jgi:hypothetical protein
VGRIEQVSATTVDCREAISELPHESKEDPKRVAARMMIEMICLTLLLFGYRVKFGMNGVLISVNSRSRSYVMAIIWRI